MRSVLITIWLAALPVLQTASEAHAVQEDETTSLPVQASVMNEDEPVENGSLGNGRLSWRILH